MRPVGSSASYSFESPTMGACDPPRDLREEGTDVLHGHCEVAFSGTGMPMGTRQVIRTLKYHDRKYRRGLRVAIDISIQKRGTHVSPPTWRYPNGRNMVSVFGTSASSNAFRPPTDKSASQISWIKRKDGMFGGFPRRNRTKRHSKGQPRGERSS